MNAGCGDDGDDGDCLFRCVCQVRIVPVMVMVTGCGWNVVVMARGMEWCDGVLWCYGVVIQCGVGCGSL